MSSIGRWTPRPPRRLRASTTSGIRIALRVEPETSDEVIRALEARGHVVELSPRHWSAAEVIVVDSGNRPSPRRRGPPNRWCRESESRRFLDASRLGRSRQGESARGIGPLLDLRGLRVFPNQLRCQWVEASKRTRPLREAGVLPRRIWCVGAEWSISRSKCQSFFHLKKLRSYIVVSRRETVGLIGRRRDPKTRHSTRHRNLSRGYSAFVDLFRPDVYAPFLGRGGAAQTHGR